MLVLKCKTEIKKHVQTNKKKKQNKKQSIKVKGKKASRCVQWYWIKCMKKTEQDQWRKQKQILDEQQKRQTETNRDKNGRRKSKDNLRTTTTPLDMMASSIPIYICKANKAKAQPCGPIEGLQHCRRGAHSVVPNLFSLYRGPRLPGNRRPIYWSAAERRAQSM